MADPQTLSLLAQQNNPFYARMYLSTDTAVASGARVPFDTVDFDPSGMCTIGASALITIPVSGLYAIYAGVQQTGSINFVAIVGKNAGDLLQLNYQGSGATLSQFSGSDIAECAAGDTLILGIGSAITAKGLRYTTFLSVCLQRLL